MPKKPKHPKDRSPKTRHPAKFKEPERVILMDMPPKLAKHIRHAIREHTRRGR